MAERSAYSRVYWSIIDDPKFVSVYDDNDCLATWLRLLMIADQSHPAPGHLPRSARAAIVAKLAKIGLIDLQPGERFRVHGLEAERARRREDSERIRTRNPGAPSPHAMSARNGGAHVRAVGKTREDETREDEEGNARDALDTYQELTGWRPWGQFSGEKLHAASGDYSDQKVDAALRAEYAKDGNRDTLLTRSLARLAKDADRRKEEAKAKPKTPRAVANEELMREERRISQELQFGSKEPA